MPTTVIPIRGPFLGVEERESAQKPESAAVSINVDYSRGFIEPRRGFENKLNAIAVKRAQIHHFTSSHGEEYLLLVGPKANGDIMFLALSKNGQYLKKEGSNFTAGQNLTTAFGEPNNPEFRCSFVDMLGPQDSDGDGAIDTASNVCLVTTQYATYVFDPTYYSEFEMTNTMLSRQQAAITVAYWLSPPRGDISVMHQQCVFYAGFRRGETVTLSDPLEDAPGEGGLATGKHDKSMKSLEPDFIQWSDLYDPFALQQDNYAAIEPGEKVTGMVSFQGNLVIFSDKGVYLLVGIIGSGTPLAMHKVVHGVGCVAPDSVVNIGDSILFMSHDGIYAFVGGSSRLKSTQGMVQKISDPIGSLWGEPTASHSTPRYMAGFLSSAGWPFKISGGGQNLTQALHIPGRNEVWFSIQCQMHAPFSFALTAVYNYKMVAWTFYIKGTSVYGGEDGAQNPKQIGSCMFSGCVVRDRNVERIFTTSADSELQEYGVQFDQSKALDTKNHGIPMCWLSGRLFRESDMTTVFRPVRMKMLSRGRSYQGVNSMGPAARGFFSTPVMFVTGEESHCDHDAEGPTAVDAVTDPDRQQTTAGIPMHPNPMSKSFWGNLNTVQNTITAASLVDELDLVGAVTYGNDGIAPPKMDWGDAKWMERDWFSSTPQCGSVRSRSCRVGFYVWGRAAGAGYRIPGDLVIQSFSIESDVGDQR